MDEPSLHSLLTQRLTLIPLAEKSLGRYLRNDGSLEREMGLSGSPQPLPPELREALGEQILPSLQAHPAEWKFFTLWMLKETETKVLVGDICFKGGPNERGEIEIGYGLYPEFRGKGLMTEGVARLLEWAFSQPGVRVVLAETERANLPSHGVLSRLGFCRYEELGEMIHWRLDSPPTPG